MGRLPLFSANWNLLTSDPWIENVVKGLTVNFSSFPHQNKPRVTPSFGIEKDNIIQSEIDSLLKKGAIRKAHYTEGQFISTIFLVDKKSGGKRPVINLKDLNQFVEKEHFKISGLHNFLQQIEKDDYMFTLDLSDAYFSIPLAEDQRKFFRFIWKNQIYEFLVMPFGLTSAPFIFTKLTKPIMAHLHSRGLRSNIFIDDVIGLIHKTVSLCSAHAQRDYVIDLFRKLGFVINEKKSSLKMSHTKVYLGFVLNSHTMEVSITPEKMQDILTSIQAILNLEKVTIEQLASVIGKIIAIFPAVYTGQLHYRTLEIVKIHHLRLTGSFKAHMTLPPEAVAELKWWLTNLPTHNGKFIHPPKVDFVIQTDASRSGWGATFQDQAEYGSWDIHQANLHINYLEMTAVKLALQRFASSVHNIHIQIQTDNTTVVTYINKMGGTHSHALNDLTKQIWNWAITKKIHLSAVHLPGVLNSEADYLSRLHQEKANWQLCPTVFNSIIKILPPPQIDLFADHWNHQLQSYVSWKLDQQAVHTNAFTLQWTNLKAYAFPPFALILRVLNKIKNDAAQVILVTPKWPTQSWWPIALHLSFRPPIIITPRDDLLIRKPGNIKHPLRKTLHLVAWSLSGDPILNRTFRQELHDSSWLLGEKVLPGNINPHGLDGIAGVVENKLIPYIHL